MPLTNTREVFKNFPADFALHVTKHVRRRRECYKAINEDKNDDPVPLTCEDNFVEQPSWTPASVKSAQMWRACGRPCTPLDGITDTESLSDSENSSAPVTPNIRPDQPPLYPRLVRGESKTTLSLDNVDLWESDSESDAMPKFDQAFITAKAITLDLSYLRRSRSPVVCKRSKLGPLPTAASYCNNQTNVPRETSTEKRRSCSKQRTPPPRGFRSAFPNPKCSKNDPTRHKVRVNSFEKVGLHKPIETTPRLSLIDKSTLRHNQTFLAQNAGTPTLPAFPDGSARNSVNEKPASNSKKKVSFCSEVSVKGYDTLDTICKHNSDNCSLHTKYKP